MHENNLKSRNNIHPKCRREWRLQKIWRTEWDKSHPCNFCTPHNAHNTNHMDMKLNIRCCHWVDWIKTVVESTQRVQSADFHQPDHTLYSAMITAGITVWMSSDRDPRGGLFGSNQSDNNVIVYVIGQPTKCRDTRNFDISLIWWFEPQH